MSPSNLGFPPESLCFRQRIDLYQHSLDIGTACHSNMAGGKNSIIKVGKIALYFAQFKLDSAGKIIYNSSEFIIILFHLLHQPESVHAERSRR